MRSAAGPHSSSDAVRNRGSPYCYHDIAGEERGGFARQMQALGRHATVLRVGYTGSLPRASLYVAITFADTSRAVRKHRVPELLDRSFASTIFVPVDFVERAPGCEMENNSE
jgi:hypothetical protein